MTTDEKRQDIMNRYFFHKEGFIQATKDWNNLDLTKEECEESK